jgi:hypothetical protein
MKGLLVSGKVVSTEVDVFIYFCSKYSQVIHVYCYFMGLVASLISCHNLKLLCGDVEAFSQSFISHIQPKLWDPGSDPFHYSEI